MDTPETRSRIVLQESNLHGFRGLTMDAFGTLLDGGPTRVPAALERAAAEVGSTWNPASLQAMWITAFRKHLQTEPYVAFREVHQMTFQELHDRLGLHTAVDHWVDETFEEYTNSKAYPEVPSVVRELEREVPLAVISNMDTKVLLRALQKNGLHFSFVVASDEEQQYKPSASLFRRAVRYLGLPAGNVLHVGDSYAEDVVGADAAGMGSLLIHRDGSPETPEMQTNHVVRDLREVRDFLRRSWSKK